LTEFLPMNRAPRLALTLLIAPAALALAALSGPAPAPAADTPGDATLVPVKWEDYRARLAANKAKARYTLVDAWSTTCGPCKENFPHLVEMHKKYAKKGLAVVSLALDDISDPKAIDEARRFLKQNKAEFTNYLMDEEFGVGFEKLEINAIPAVFLYGPDGKEVKRFTMDDADNQFTYDQVEKEVVSLLGGKGGKANK
jgi:thiol-disulfide isomerase/thioredoxin